MPTVTSLRRFALVLLAAAPLLGAQVQAAAPAFPVQPISEAQAAEYQLDGKFFRKATLVQDILIATSEKVSDFTHREAAYQFDMVMKTLRPEIAQRSVAIVGTYQPLKSGFNYSAIGVVPKPVSAYR